MTIAQLAALELPELRRRAQLARHLLDQAVMRKAIGSPFREELNKCLAEIERREGRTGG